MKTIDEAAKHSFDMLSIAGADIDWIDFKHPFRIGVEFAQRWISVEEELPESSDNLLLVKYKDAKESYKYGLARYFDMSFLRNNKSKTLNFTIQGSCPRDVTHWRPIELK